MTAPPRAACDRTHIRDRHGAVLPAVIVAVAVLGLLAASLAVSTRTAASAATGAVSARRASDAAHGAAHGALRDWATRAHDTLRVGGTHTSVITSGDVTVQLRVARLDPATFAVDAEASLRPAGARVLARRAVRLLVAADPLRSLPAAALTLGAPLDADAASEITGADTMPPGWWCDATDTASVASIAADPDPAQYALPPPPMPPSFAATAPADSLAPLGAAQLPFVHVRGDHALVGRAVQGVLVVDGDLTLAAGAEVWGVVVVGGTLQANSARVMGAVLARGQPGVPHVVRAVRVRWSSCVVAAALRAAGTVRPVTSLGLTVGR